MHIYQILGQKLNHSSPRIVDDLGKIIKAII